MVGPEDPPVVPNWPRDTEPPYTEPGTNGSFAASGDERGGSRHGFVAPNRFRELYELFLAIGSVVLSADTEADAIGWTLVGVDGTAAPTSHAAVMPMFAWNVLHPICA